MHYLAHCLDGTDGPQLRNEHLAAHLQFIESHLGELAVAGPLLDDDGEMIGSCFIIVADSEAEARNWLARDPYFQAGIWDSVQFHPFQAVAGQWVGGVTW